ncbi:MAG: PAS domain S-box protein [Deltaproteobacteria bacterium]
MMLRPFFLENQDYVALFCAASFFLLGMASILLHMRQKGGVHPGYAWVLLSLFSFFLCGYECMQLVSYELMLPGLGHDGRNVLLAAAFISLFEFGVLRSRRSARVPLNLFVLLPLLACVSVVAFSSGKACACEGVIRYFLAFPAALFAGLAFWRWPQTDQNVFSFRLARVTGILFLFYGFLAGWIVPASPVFRPLFLSEQAFFSFFGLPVLIFRGGIAVFLAAIFIWRSARSFFSYRTSLGLNRRSAVFLPVSFGILYAVFLLLGWHLVRAVTVHERENVKRLVFKEARLYGEALLVSPGIDVLGLEQDSEYPALRYAHHRMVDLAQKDSFAQALYLVKLEEGRPVFLVGSQAQVFPSVLSPAFGRDVPVRQIMDAFHARRPTFAGPYATVSGVEGFSVFLPLDRGGSTTPYLLGLDLDGPRILGEVRRTRLFALFGVMAFLILLIVAYGFLIIFAVKNTELEVQKGNLDAAVVHLRETEAELVRSEETFRGILSNSPNAIFGFDRDLRLIFWNEGAGRLYGFAREEVLNEKNPVESRRIVELLGAQDHESALSDVFRGQTLVREVGHRTKSGATVDVVLTAFPVRDPQKNILFAMALVQDISEHKRLEAELERERDRLRIIAAHIGAGLCLIGRDFKIQWLNEVMEGWFGKLEAARGCTCFSVFHRKEAICADCPTEKAFRTGALATAESRVTYPDGRVTVFSIISAPVKDENGVTQQVLELVLDVTERKRLEEELQGQAQMLEALVEERTAALQSSELMFRRLFESAQDGILIMDSENGRIIDINPYLLQLLGMTRADLQGRLYGDVRCFAENPVLRDIPRDLKDKITVFYEDVVVATSAGRETDLEVRASWYTVQSRRVIQCHLRDITERKKIEKIKSEFVSMVSHELRTPLSAIKEGVEIVADGTQGRLRREQKVCLEIALSNIRRLNRLIGDILDISKIQSNLLTVDMAPCDIAPTIDQVCDLAKLEIEKRGLVLVTDIEKGLPRVLADRDRLIQVLMNLLNNAVKFTREKSRIRLSVRRSGAKIEFAVADEGPGIPQEELARLFGRFVQLDSTLVRRVGGTGLGLYISKNLVEAMGGRIWAESRPPQGAEFVFTLAAEKA